MSEESFDIIVFLSRDWDNYHRQHMLSELCRIHEGKVLLLERAVSIVDFIFKPKKAFRKLFGKAGLRKLKDNSWLFTPLYFLYDHLARKSAFLAKFNSIILAAQIRPLLKRLKFSETRRFLYLYSPNFREYIGSVCDETHLVCEYHDIYHIHHKTFKVDQDYKAKEEEMFRLSDAVICTSKPLFERASQWNSNAHWIPNGVNFGLFNQATHSHWQLPKDLESIPHPIIGSIGHIRGVTDLETITYAAREHTNKSFVFIGSIHRPPEDLIELKMLPNVYFLGPKPYEELPAYLASFDVAILAYYLNDYSRNMDALKILEYFSAAKPVVATYLPSLEPYEDLICVSRSREAFSNGITELIENISRIDPEKLIKAARQNSWETRVASILAILAEASDRTRTGSDMENAN